MKCLGAGYKALFLSVEVPVLGHRLNEYRNDFMLPAELSFPNILSGGLKEFAEGENSHDYGQLIVPAGRVYILTFAYFTTIDAGLEWAEIIPWLRKNTKMQIWLKGSRCTAHVSILAMLTDKS